MAFPPGVPWLLYIVLTPIELLSNLDLPNHFGTRYPLSFMFLLTALWPRPSAPVVSASEVPAEPVPGRFRWKMLVRLLAFGMVPILLIAGSIAVGKADVILSALFHGLIGAGLAY
jgi:hypothetical protein